MRRPPPRSCSRIRDATSRSDSRSRGLLFRGSVYYGGATAGCDRGSPDRADLELLRGGRQTRQVRVGRESRYVLLCLLGALPGVACTQQPRWVFGPFEKPGIVNPILAPNRDATFRSPMNDTVVRWEQYATFNPAAVVKDGQVSVPHRPEGRSRD